MTASGRSSGRVVDDSTSPLGNGAGSANSGADGRESLAVTASARSGRRRHGGRVREAVASQLSDRHWQILHSLQALPYLTTRQLQRWHYPPSEFTPTSAARTSRQALRRLAGFGLVDHLERRIGGVRAGSSGFVWSLTAQGATLLGEDTRRRWREPSISHLEHSLAIAELVVQVEETTEQGPIHALTVETEPRCWREVPVAQGGLKLLKPDLRLTLTAGELELHWFVEIDRATEHRPALARKCRTYLRAWQAGVEAEHGIFPRVLWVVPDEERAAVLRAVIGQLPGAPAGMFVVCTAAQAITVLQSGGGAA